MLVLTRKLDESIIIGEKIEIKVLEVRGDQVRLGIVAPREISVHRKELYEKIKAMNIASGARKEQKIIVPKSMKKGGEGKENNVDSAGDRTIRKETKEENG